MYFINPFKGLRPKEEEASSVVIASTDHLSKQDIENFKNKNPWNYLNVFAEENNKKSKEQFNLMKKKSILTKDKENSFYIYKISTADHAQVGIVGTAKLSAYDNLHIRGHEEIFLERAQKRLKQMDNLNAQIGPIYVIYPDNEELTELIKKEIVEKPTYSFDALDKCKHEMWIVNEENKVKRICDLFNSINRIYIADGHHRMEALSKLSEFKKHRNPNHTGNELYNYFMVAIFPQSQARLLDYNRLIKDLYGYSEKNFIKEVKKKFKVEKQSNSFKPKKPQTFGMYLDKQWYSLELKEPPEENLFHIINLDINLLHYYLLEPILGIGDPRYDNRIDFLAGFHGLEGIENKVDTNYAKVGFALFATQMENVISFADKKLNMPPKSTWFDPKPLDGLIAYDFE
jgi:uncharacterized protein (DUF1015 family)|tara:strand:+ start:867 stop:2069 length:1203 start_codon:yes stop_codon:yes gene_type:complete